MSKRADDGLSVRVVRSGGFAGISREWCIQSPPVADDRLLPLVEACPWQRIPPPDHVSRDRFVWRIEVRGTVRRTATLPDAALEGPWRELVRHVQEHAADER